MVRTERLTLRPVAPGDVDLLVELDSDAEVVRFITGGRPTSPEAVAASISRGVGWQWLAYDRADGAFVGWFALDPVGDGSFELGYRLRRDAWGRGLATEGARALIDLAFTDHGATRVWAQTMAVNRRSRAVLERCGLRYVRTFRGDWDDPIAGSEHGEVEYEIRRSGWAASAPARGIADTWVRVHAPVRVLDAGGWTDTWFAGAGSVCHVAVGPGSTVLARLVDSTEPTTVVDLDVPDFGDRYTFTVDRPPGRHPLLEAAVRRWAPAATGLEVTVGSSVPPGSGLGTSASVVVALIAALQSLGGPMAEPAAVAAAAHAVETVDLGLQSGVQDQAAAAHGGCNLLTIDRYPAVAVRRLDLAPATWEALDRRLVTVYLGAPHASSAVHEAVIAHLGSSAAARERLLEPLRDAARRAAAALTAGDLDAYGDAMRDNSRAQAALHPALVSPPAHDVIERARSCGAAGWKVNGAGGDGGTVTVVGPDDPGGLVEDLQSRGLVVLPLHPDPQGVRVVDRA